MILRAQKITLRFRSKKPGIAPLSCESIRRRRNSPAGPIQGDLLVCF